MTPQQRIKELQTRQRWDSSSMSVRLNAVNGKWFYNVIVFVSTDEKKVLPVGGEHGLCLQRKKVGELYQATIERKDIVLAGKYNGEDPEELIKQAEKIVGKWKCGVQVKKPVEIQT